MKIRIHAAVVFGLAVSAFGQTSESGGNSHEPPVIGIVWAKGVEAAGDAGGNAVNQARSRGANMTYHGGKIMPNAVSQAIFWGPSWNNSGFAGDKITGLDSWYIGFSSSNYAKTSDEYTGTNGQVGAVTTYIGHTVDPTTATGGGNTSAILAEVCKEITNPDTSGNGYYPVYVDVKRGNAGYCA